MKVSNFFKTRYQFIHFVFFIALISVTPIYGSEQIQPFDWICIPGEKVGPITSRTTENDLVKIFGEQNITHEEFYVDEGYFELGSILFKGTSNEISILWEEPDKSGRRFPNRVIIDSKNANWQTDNGIRVGTSIENLVRINGKHILFAGFDWDYGGVVLDWNNGKLGKKSLSVRLQRKNFIDIPGTSGDGAELSSEDERLNPLELYVSRFDIILDKE